MNAVSSYSNYTPFSLTPIEETDIPDICPPEVSENVKKVALGTLTFAVSFPIIDWAERSLINFMEYCNFDLSEPQEIMQLWNAINELPYKILCVLAKTLLLAYITIIGPIVEEFIFRESLHTGLKECFNDPDSLVNKVLRILFNGVLFGACHLSPYQGWMNLPIFLLTALLGCIFAMLRECTGDITASSIAHILHNSTVMTLFLWG